MQRQMRKRAKESGTDKARLPVLNMPLANHHASRSEPANLWLSNFPLTLKLLHV